VKLAKSAPASRRGIVGDRREIATHPQLLSIVKPITLQLAVNRRTVTAEPFCDLQDGRLGFTKPKNKSPIVKGEVAIPRSHGKFLPNSN
jgi:hypothetical protein